MRLRSDQQKTYTAKSAQAETTTASAALLASPTSGLFVLFDNGDTKDPNTTTDHQCNHHDTFYVNIDAYRIIDYNLTIMMLYRFGNK